MGDTFSCAPGVSEKEFILCQCNACGGSGGGTGGGTGGGGGEILGRRLLGLPCDDWVCDNDCWWAGWDTGGCYLGECWCYSNLPQ